jgi:hypothetical protein
MKRAGKLLPFFHRVGAEGLPGNDLTSYATGQYILARRLSEHAGNQGRLGTPTAFFYVDLWKESGPR